MTLPAIPSIDGEITPQLRAILLAMKENIEVRGGQRKAADADKYSTTADVTAAATVAAAAATAAATVASTAEAIAGTENTKQMTALRMREGFNAAGSAPVFACRAWVNFNGTGTVAIRGSGNVSSITDEGVGKYLINFTTAMSDANYCAVGCAGSIDSGIGDRQLSTYRTSAATCRVISGQTSTANVYDAEEVNVAFFR